MANNKIIHKNDIIPIHTDVVLIVDRSWSMRSMNGAPKLMVQNMINEQKEISEKNNSSCAFSLVTFDNESIKRIDAKDVKKIKNHNDKNVSEWIEPRGSTRLIDTIIEEIQFQKERKETYLKTLSKEVLALNPKICCVIQIVTDGEDNMSTHNDEELNIEVIKHKEDGAHFVFLAANQDAIQTAQRFGIDDDTAMTIDNDFDSSTHGMRCASDMVCNITSGSSDTPRFSDLQRQMSAPSDTSTPKSSHVNILPLSSPSERLSPPPIIRRTLPFTSNEKFNQMILPPPPPFGLTRTTNEIV
tara:strand:- start:147 stop:1046 length:900 start_codon:yes stop_codon:yes gene_type:complete